MSSFRERVDTGVGELTLLRCLAVHHTATVNDIGFDDPNDLGRVAWELALRLMGTEHAVGRDEATAAEFLAIYDTAVAAADQLETNPSSGMEIRMLRGETPWNDSATPGGD